MSESRPSSDRSAPDLEKASEARPQYQEALEQFILFWGEMASRWGINRTMAQIHALLYGAEEPLDTDDIMERLEISRGNANMNLRSLISWNLIRKVHRPGSRKDYYTAKKDVWEITAQIIKERERREVEPVLEQLKACRDTLTAGEGEATCDELGKKERVLCERIENLMRLIEVFEGFSRALLPFVERHDGQKIQQFIEFAETLLEQGAENATSKEVRENQTS